MYGYNRYRSFKKFTPSRTTGIFSNRSNYRVQKVGNTYKKGSIKASYSKDEEKKYNDRSSFVNISFFIFMVLFDCMQTFPCTQHYAPVQVFSLLPPFLSVLFTFHNKLLRPTPYLQPQALAQGAAYSPSMAACSYLQIQSPSTQLSLRDNKHLSL